MSENVADLMRSVFRIFNLSNCFWAVIIFEIFIKEEISYLIFNVIGFI